MRKRIGLLSVICFSVILIFTACAGPYTAGVAETPDTGVVFFENGTVYTVDAQDTTAEALAIEDGKIIFVGSAEEGKPYRDAAEEIVDLKGGMLLPGFIDAHIHSVTPNFFDFVVYEDTDIKSVLKTIETYVKANPDNVFYTGYGYLTSIFEGDELAKGPRKERLDEICPDKPMVILSFDGHAAWLNSKAFELSGITEETASTPGGEIPKDDATGQVWGTLKDSAMSMVKPELLEVPTEKMLDVLQEFQMLLNSYGYTSIMTLPANGFFPIPWEGYVAMEDEELLSLRVRGASVVTSWQTEQDIASLGEMKEKYDSDLVALTTAKIFADGVMDSESALLLEPYTDNPQNYGETVWTQDDMNETVAAINAAGMQAHTHAIGDGAVRMALNASEYAREGAPTGDYRNAITHLQLVSPEDIPRFAELGVIPVAQPYWHYKEPGYWETIEYPALGERAEREYPMNSFLDNGATLVFSSDYPVTVDPNPFVAIEIGVTRNMPDGSAYGLTEIKDMDDPVYLLWPEERLTVKEMIRGFTADAAYSLFAENETGTLEVGKSADMIIIDQNLFEIDPLEISETSVLQTYLKGQLVYSIK